MNTTNAVFVHLFAEPTQRRLTTIIGRDRDGFGQPSADYLDFSRTGYDTSSEAEADPDRSSAAGGGRGVA